MARPALRLGPGLAGTAFADVAKVLDLSVADLKADLMKGQSLADIAKTQKVDVNKVIKTLVDDAIGASSIRPSRTSASRRRKPTR